MFFSLTLLSACYISCFSSLRILNPTPKFSTSLQAVTIIKPVFDDKCATTGVTLSRYILEAVNANPHLRELESLVLAIQTACKQIANIVDRASINGQTGLQGGGGSINVQGEEQKKLDGVYSKSYTLQPVK